MISTALVITCPSQEPRLDLVSSKAHGVCVGLGGGRYWCGVSTLRKIWILFKVKQMDREREHQPSKTDKTSASQSLGSSLGIEYGLDSCAVCYGTCM